MDIIKFANGEVHSGSVSAFGDKAYIALSDVSFAEAAAILSDPEKTAIIEVGERVLTGYTNLLMLTAQEYGYEGSLRGNT